MIKFFVFILFFTSFSCLHADLYEQVEKRYKFAQDEVRKKINEENEIYWINVGKIQAYDEILGLIYQEISDHK